MIFFFFQIFIYIDFDKFLIYIFEKSQQKKEKKDIPLCF